MGAPGCGKTWAALTFPNPLVLNTDNKLPRGRVIANIPMHDQEYQRELFRAYGKKSEFVNMRDAVKLWFEQEMHKIDQRATTLVIDSWTMINNACDVQGNKEVKPSPRTGELDKRQMWGEKLNYCFYLHEMLKQYQGTIISVCHEFIERDDKGQPITGFSPLFTGGFKDQFAAHYTNFWRMQVDVKADYKWKFQLMASPVFNPICSFTPPVAMVDARYDAVKALLSGDSNIQP